MARNYQSLNVIKMTVNNELIECLLVDYEKLDNLIGEYVPLK